MSRPSCAPHYPCAPSPSCISRIPGILTAPSETCSLKPFSGPSLHSRRDACGVVREAFEAGEAFDVGAEVLQGILGEVDVVGTDDEVVGTEGGGPGCCASRWEGVRRAGGVVAEGDGAEVSDGDHAGGFEVVEDGLVVFGDDVRVFRGVEVADLDGLRQVFDTDRKSTRLNSSHLVI